MMVRDVWTVLRHRQVPGTFSTLSLQCIGYGLILIGVFGGITWSAPIGMSVVVTSDYYSNSSRANIQLMQTLHIAGVRHIVALYARSVIYTALPLCCLVVALLALAPMSFHADVEPPAHYLFWGAVAGTGMLVVMVNTLRVYFSRAWRGLPVTSSLILAVAIVGLTVLAYLVGNKLVVEPNVVLAPLVAVAACWTVAMLCLNAVAISLRARQDLV